MISECQVSFPLVVTLIAFVVFYTSVALVHVLVEKLLGLVGVWPLWALVTL